MDLEARSVAAPNRSCGGGSRRLRIPTALVEGRSAYDAWLNAASSQVAQVLLTLPMSFAQTGMAAGIIFQIAYGFMGCWSVYMATSLYVTYRDMAEREHIYPENHDIQWYEVLGGLLGPYWKYTGLFFLVGLLILQSSICLLGASSLGYFLNSSISKRDWTFIFGVLFLFTVLIPRLQNYRTWSFIGIIMTTYAAWFLTLAAVFHGKKQNVRHAAPFSHVGYFTGATNILYAFGGHGFTMELTHAMRDVRKFKHVYLLAIMYVWTLTLPSAIAVYWAFGDAMAHIPYAIAAFSRTKYRDTAIVLMIMHQFIIFGVSMLPVYLMWEKLLGIHEGNQYLIKSVARVPIVLLVWFLALMIPFIGLIDTVVGSFFTSITIYILPCVGHMVLYRTQRSRKQAVEQPPWWVPAGWKGFFYINTVVVLWVAIVGVGIGAWAGSIRLSQNVKQFGLFASCYQCHGQQQA